MRCAEAWHPLPRLPIAMDEQIGLDCRKSGRASLLPCRLHPFKAVDSGRVQVRMIDSPACAMRPINRDVITLLATEKFMTWNPERSGLEIQQSILEGTQCGSTHPIGCGTQWRHERSEHTFVLTRRQADQSRRQPLDNRRQARRSEGLVKLTPAHSAIIGSNFEKVVVPPAGIATQCLSTLDFHTSLLTNHWLLNTDNRNAAYLCGAKAIDIRFHTGSGLPHVRVAATIIS